jgi:hypothetical protein
LVVAGSAITGRITPHAAHRNQPRRLPEKRKRTFAHPPDKGDALSTAAPIQFPLNDMNLKDTDISATARADPSMFSLYYEH